MDLNPHEVRSHVGIAMREIIVRRTHYTESTYTESIVPSNPRPQGLGAEGTWWYGTLNRVGQLLASQHPVYGVLEIDPADGPATVGKPINETNNVLTKRIVKQAKQLAVG